MKRIKEELHIKVDYLPNGHFEIDDDWELKISVNDNCACDAAIRPFGKSMKNLTVNELVKEIKDKIEEEVFGNV